MTTNTYTNLCDSVGAYEITYTYDIEGINWFGGIFTQTFTRNEFKEDAWRWKTKEYRVIKVNKKNIYPPATAEQRERLEELIELNIGESEHLAKSKATQFLCNIFNCEKNASVYFAYEQSRPDALYALTHKLVQEGVLSKEEVAKALKGEFND